MVNDQVAKQKDETRGFKCILIILIIVAISLASGIVFLNIYNSEYRTWEREFGIIGSEQLSNSVDHYTFEKSSKKGELQIYLRQSLDKVTTSSDLASSCQYLARLLQSDGKNTEATEAIEVCLNNSSITLSSVDKSLLLAQLLSIYQLQNDIQMQILVLRQIVDLPDDMVLEGQDWSKLKPLLIKQLRQLEEKQNEIKE